MAYLNVRERRIETKIAYVGPELAGKATNLQQLQSDVARGRTTQLLEEELDGGSVASFEWAPLEKSRFRDCDVAVRIVAAHGALSADRLDRVLADVDGVVVVIDAAPSAQDENRRAVSLVREALTKDAGASRQVVVQLNKSDLDDAIDTRDVAATLETREWPVVKASAARGEGVLETLEMALSNVISAMNTPDLAAADVKVDHNPLLTALRQILRDTVTEHMATLEQQALARMTQALGSRGADGASERLEQMLIEQREAIAALRSEQITSTTDTARANVTLEHASAELGRQLDHVTSELASIAATTRETGDIVRALTAQVAQVEERCGAIPTRDDMAALEQRALAEAAARGRVEREYVTAAVAVIRRGVEGVAAELKKQQEVSTQLAEIAEGLQGLKTSLMPGAAAAAGVPARLAGLETSLAARLARLDDTVQVVQGGLGESAARSDAQLNELQAGMRELIEELKKPKKGWFG